MAVRTSAVLAKVLHANAPTSARVSSALAKVAHVNTLQAIVVNAVMAKVLFVPPIQPAQVTSVLAKVLYGSTPDFSWIVMFSEDATFPHDISFDSMGSTTWLSDTTQVDSGFDQRITRWDQPLMEYNVSYGVRTMEQLHSLIRHFRAMRGKTIAFRYRDHVDFSSSFAVVEEARQAPEITPQDQRIGTGNGVTIQFQLRKNYIFEDETQQRTIQKPVPGTVAVSVDNVEVTNWTCDYTTGLVTFYEEHVVEGITDFFVDDPSGGVYRCSSGSDPLFVDFFIGERVYISGHSITANNNKPCVIVDKAMDGSWVDLDPESGSLSAGVSVTPTQLATVAPPKDGSAVRAGFLFDVPVRYDVDRLPVTLEHYGIGSATEVRLKEVRV